ncbi:MAG: hypothetical protein WD898_01745 [Candidatus Paceibacterota bacterium]
MENSNQNNTNMSQQPTGSPDSMMYASSDHKKTPYWLLIVAVVVLVGLWFWLKDSKQEAGLQPTPTESVDPEVQEVILEVDNIDIGDLDAEFDSIDQDLDSL